jgi:hypothetical protein
VHDQLSRTHSPEAKVIIVTKHTDGQTGAVVLEAGAWVFFAKDDLLSLG